MKEFKESIKVHVETVAPEKKVKVKRRINPMRFICVGAAGVLLVGLGLEMSVAYAEEVSMGYIINRANLSKANQQTFDGHNLGAMITPVQRKMITELNLTIKLAPTKPMAVPPSYLAMTEKYSKNVKYDKATRRISGYVAGLPFPDLSEADPDLANKIIWNQFYGNALNTDTYLVTTEIMTIDAVKGMERSVILTNPMLKLKHRYSVEPVAPKVVGDGEIYRKVLMFNLAPQDVAGTGAYIQRYDDGRVDDSWAYIKSVRRVRRMSGGTWMDPVPGLAIVNDDTSCYDSFPTWYPTPPKVVAKQWVLAIGHGVPPGGAGYKMENYIDLKNPPYWNLINQPWEPREVFVVDTFPPEAHPYSRRRIYYDIQAKVILYCEMYNKKGELWKMFALPFAEHLMADGQPGSGGLAIWVVDFQFMRANYGPITYGRLNDPKVEPGDLSSDSLSHPERFTAEELTKRFGPSTFKH